MERGIFKLFKMEDGGARKDEGEDAQIANEIEKITSISDDEKKEQLIQEDPDDQNSEQMSNNPSDQNSNHSSLNEQLQEEKMSSEPAQEKKTDDSLSPYNEKETTIQESCEKAIQRVDPCTTKVKIHLVAVGSAPILKKAKFLLNATSPFSILQNRLRKMLQLTDKDTLYLYVQQSFTPCSEDWIGDLNDLYNIRGELQIHYSLQEAWG